MKLNYRLVLLCFAILALLLQATGCGEQQLAWRIETGKPISNQSAHERLTWVGLADKLNNYPAQLSGGQQTRVALARALAHNPELLLADEPTGSLDVDSEREIMDLLIEINRTQKTTIVMVTHNPALAAAANHHYVMERGHLTEVSRPIEREVSHEA